ncbi:MAG TPA: imelysin family protein [Kofleriaceae bacterium]|nr:imelysin family protein [Kofleriaceae bacterium]
MAVGALGACGGDDGGDLATEAQPVIERYADAVRTSYVMAVDGVEGLQTAVDAFVAAPSADTLTAARTAWVSARLAYRPTEAFRFYGGPIDDPADEREPLINAWPMDEAYVDYVMGNATAGIINDTTGFPTIDANALGAANLVGGDANVATGYHAVEFLLWGQDMNANGPGARPHTDYADGGTASNQLRRRQYLTVVTQLLVDDLTHVSDRWAEDASYKTTFTGAPVESLTRMLTGIGTLAASELSGERMLTAYENKDQEDEHSCFSDTTRDDLIGNMQGIENVYLGRYNGQDGAGLDELVATRDAALDTRMKTQLTAAITAINAIPAPFDQAILGEDSSAGRMAVLNAVRAIQDVGDTVVDIAEALDVPVSTEL